MNKKHVSKSESKWKAFLTNLEFNVLRKKTTEFPFIRKYVNNKEDGIYLYAGLRNSSF